MAKSQQSSDNLSQFSFSCSSRDLLVQKDPLRGIYFYCSSNKT